MISWMQKHKKYLISTIWISGIAFVGAGFVGWGSYDFGHNKSSTILEVGKTPVTIQDFQSKLAAISMMLGKNLSEDEINKLGLKDRILNELTIEAMLLNFANDLGIIATNEDVAKEIISNPDFQKNGKFDKEIYTKLISRIGLTPVEYENDLKKSVILKKLSNALNLQPSKDDIDLIGARNFMQDKLSIEVVSSDNNITVDDNQIKDFWQKNKSEYKTEKSYILNTLLVKPKDANISDNELNSFWANNKTKYLDENKKIKDFNASKEEVYKDYIAKIAKQDALKDYLKVKKGELKTDSTIVISENNSTFPVDKIRNLKEGDVLKPFEFDGGNLIVKVAKITPSKEMSYDEAKDMAKSDLLNKKRLENLEEKAKQAVNNFNGRDVGYVTRGTNYIEGLSNSETELLIKKIFSKEYLKGYIIIANKAIIYNVTEQNLTNNAKIKENFKLLESAATQVVNSNLKHDIIDILSKRYKIEQYQR